jgi:hypothetical protein
MLFRQGDWGELTEKERGINRRAIRMAQTIKEARAEYRAGGEGTGDV